MSPEPNSIPRPLVRTNQWVIVSAVLLTWITGVYWFLAVPLLAGIGGILFDFNPVMRIAKEFLKKPPSAYLQEDKAQQKFNQLLAVFFLAAALLSYAMEWAIPAYLFSIMVAAAAFVAILGFCVGCFIHYQWTQIRHRRRNQA